ncbi:MAG: helical backbone metal receptor [Bernardetiaceae bacterium]|nr:helical backbone metal receptor [Bernardetiaceae bacterium]
MPIFIDQMGRSVAVSTPPHRIISLVPSQTELLFDLGLQARIVGITKFCIHPPEALKRKTIVGGTKHFRMELIHRLQPDLIIGNKEENDKGSIEELSKHYPVWMSDIATLEDALNMIEAIGKLTQTEEIATAIARKISIAFADLAKPPYRQRVLYLIWRKPWMAAGKQTFIDDMLQRGGWENAITAPRYPVLTDWELHNLTPDWVFLSSEPFPFQEKHLTELRAILPHAKMLLVDGEMFSWYGSRLQYSAAYLKKLQQTVS